MKVVICGGRTFKKYQLVEDIINDAIKNGLIITQVVSGGAKGVDTMGENWAVKNGVDIKRMEAEWNKYGLSAGPIRNAKMGDYADAIIAIWDGESKGTKHMIEYATKKGLSLHIYIVKPNGEWHVATNR